MPQVSRRILNQKTQDKIFSLFISSIIICNSKNLATSLVKDLFTPSERIMLSKRFSIAYMLNEKYDYDSICEILRVSRTTVGCVSNWLKEKGEGFRIVIKKIKNDEKMKQILNDLQYVFKELILTAPGQNWRESQKILRQERKAQGKPF